VRLPCLLHGGHDWTTTRDSAGTFTRCARCGRLRHRRLGTVAHGRFEIHQNEPRGFAPIPEHGAEDLEPGAAP